MDPKRIVSILELPDGEPDPGSLASCVERVRGLELGGADEILLLAPSGGGPDRAPEAAWVREVARNLFIPLGVACPFPGPEAESLLSAGADQVLVRVEAEDLPALAGVAQSCGRERLRVGMALAWNPLTGWRASTPSDPAGRPAWAWMVEVVQMGAGELLLGVTTPGAPMEALGEMAAGLGVPVLLRAEESGAAMGALASGLDGWACLASQGAPRTLKAALEAEGLGVRK